MPGVSKDPWVRPVEVPPEGLPACRARVRQVPVVVEASGATLVPRVLTGVELEVAAEQEALGTRVRVRQVQVVVEAWVGSPVPRVLVGVVPWVGSAAALVVPGSRAGGLWAQAAVAVLVGVTCQAGPALRAPGPPV